jgi:hypothetical protein
MLEAIITTVIGNIVWALLVYGVARVRPRLPTVEKSLSTVARAPFLRSLPLWISLGITTSCLILSFLVLVGWSIGDRSDWANTLLLIISLTGVAGPLIFAKLGSIADRILARTDREQFFSVGRFSDWTNAWIFVDIMRVSALLCFWVPISLLMLPLLVAGASWVWQVSVR